MLRSGPACAVGLSALEDAKDLVVNPPSRLLATLLMWFVVSIQTFDTAKWSLGELKDRLSVPQALTSKVELAIRTANRIAEPLSINFSIATKALQWSLAIHI